VHRKGLKSTSGIHCSLRINERLTFNDSDGDKITALHAALLVGLVLPTNFFIPIYAAMLLIGALHSGVTQFPALGY
jgi:hypothetical protein